MTAGDWCLSCGYQIYSCQCLPVDNQRLREAVRSQLTVRWNPKRRREAEQAELLQTAKILCNQTEQGK